MSKNIKVSLTLEWDFNEKEWSRQQVHLEELKNNTKCTLGYDIVSSLYYLNEIVNPIIKEATAKLI